MLDVLRAELERLFDFEELRASSTRHLAIDSSLLKGANTKSALASALVTWAVDQDAVEALSDLVVTARRGADRRIDSLRLRGFESGDGLPVNGESNGFELVRRIGRSAYSTVVEAALNGRRVRMRFARPRALEDRASLQRYLVLSRLVGDLDRMGLPKGTKVMRFGSRVAVVQDLPAGSPLTQQFGNAAKLSAVWYIVRGILEGLSALHRQRLVHGALHPDNVLVEGEQGAGFVTLVDAGSHFLRARELVGGTASGRIGMLPLAYASPEQLVGEIPTPRSDVYAFGLVLYGLLTGRHAFQGEGRGLVTRRFGPTPEPLSFAAPRGWIVPELDELMLALLDEDPSGRPADAEAVLDMLEAAAVHSQRVASTYPDEAFETFLLRLEEAPSDEMAAALLEASIEQGASATRVAEAFSLAGLKLGEEPGMMEARRRLLLKAGALFEGLARDGKAAVSAYRVLLEDNPHDDVVWASLERALRGLGQYAELVEWLVTRADRAGSSDEKARILETVGELLANKLDEPAQAIVAYAHALVEAPGNRGLVQAIERLAGSDRLIWREVLDTLAKETAELQDTEDRNQLLAVMGAWHRDRLGRLDLSLQCYQSILLADPANDDALSAIADLCRRARQWPELVDVLLERAQGAVTPATSRDLRVEAAGLLARKLDDPDRAMQLYESVLEEDPTHGNAAQALSELYLAANRIEEYIQLARSRAVLLMGAKRLDLLFDLARVHESRLDDDASAIALYEQIVSEAPTHVRALRRLDAAYSAAGMHEELIGTLSRELDLSVSPRQKSRLLRRMVRVYSRDLMDKERAANTLERLLDVDPSFVPALEDLEDLYRDLRRWAPLAWTFERHAARLGNPQARADKLLELGELAAGPLDEPVLAIDAYERVRAIRPKDATALGSLVSLRAKIGDDVRAAEALEQLAEAEPNPKQRAEYEVRAGGILLLRGETQRAVTLLRRALEAFPGHAGAASKLHAALLASDDVEAALRVLERGILDAKDLSAKARLSAELGETQWARRGDAARAQAAAVFAIEHDPDNVQARLLLAELVRTEGNLEEAARRYKAISSHRRELDAKRAARLLQGYADTLARLGDKDGALRVVDELLADFGHERDALLAASDVAFRVEDNERAMDLASALIHNHGRSLPTRDLSRCLYRRGESLRRMGRPDEATAPLERAASIDPKCLEPLRSLMVVYRAQQQWVKVSETLLRVLERVEGDARVEVLLEMGELAEGELEDRTTAAKTYLAALAERPGDRRILLKLARLYSVERDWAHLIDSILRLVEITNDKQQQAKYLQTAALVALEEMKDLDRADEILSKALQADPTNTELVSRAIAVKTEMNDIEGVRSTLRELLRKALQRRDTAQAASLALKLAEVHVSWGWMDEAIAVLERTLDEAGRDPDLDQMLLDLYAKDPIRYLDRAAELTRVMLASAPHRPEPYKTLRRMYSEAKRMDATWLTCQALTVLGAAETNEMLYFKRFRLSGPIPKTTRITDQECSELIEHPYVDPTLTKILRLIEPSVLAARGERLADLGYDERDSLDPDNSPLGIVPMIFQVAQILGQPAPLLFENPTADVPVTMLPADRPVLLLSSSAVDTEMPAAQAAFIAATHLCYFRRGYYVRALIPLLTLKAWLQAATKLVVPSLPVASDLAGLTREAQAHLTENLTGAMHDRLARAVHDLLSLRTRPDIVRWTAGVDLTSDRFGLVISDDLPSCLAVIAKTQKVGNTLSSSERGRDLLEYSVSGAYLRLRDRLQLSVDWRELDDLPLDDEVVNSSPGV